MVNVNSNLKRNLAFIFGWSGIGILCWSGCASDGTTDTNALSESGAAADTELFDRHDAGDGKDEIAIVSSSGCEYIVVFGNSNGEWQEIEIPYEVYDCDLSA